MGYVWKDIIIFIGVIGPTDIWMQAQEHTYPDFSAIVHQCGPRRQ